MAYDAAMPNTLTDDQIRDTVARAGYRSPDVILKHALAGDPNTRFAVFNHFVRLNPEHPISRAHLQDTAGMHTAGVINHPSGSSHLDIPLMRKRCEECQP